MDLLVDKLAFLRCTRHRELAAGDYPLPPIIPVLLERIGDYEESVIEVVMQAITSARYTPSVFSSERHGK